MRPDERAGSGWGAAAAGLVALLTTGCGAAAGATEPAAAPTAARARPAPRPTPALLPGDLAEAPVGEISSTRHGVTIPLPDPNGWRLVADRSSFFVLDHPASSSRLVVRLWRETENMNRERCEARARALRELPARNPAGGLSRELRAIPPEFDTVVEAALAERAPAEPLAGYVMAFGGFARRCFAFVYTTSATGPAAEQVVSDRLAVMDARALTGLELDNALAPVPRETSGTAP